MVGDGIVVHEGGTERVSCLVDREQRAGGAVDGDARDAIAPERRRQAVERPAERRPPERGIARVAALVGEARLVSAERFPGGIERGDANARGADIDTENDGLVQRTTPRSLETMKSTNRRTSAWASISGRSEVIASSRLPWRWSTRM